MSGHDALLRQAYTHYQKGDFAAAEAIGRQLLARGMRGGALAGMVGMCALQTGRPGDAIPHLRTALGETPDNLQLRASLAFALVNAGALDEARAVAARGDAPQLWRITAFVDQQQGRSAEAITGFRRVLRDYAQDYESWSNLGLLLSTAGEIDEAVEAFGRALALANDPSFHVARSRALARGARHPERQALLREAVRGLPDDVALRVELGLAEGAAGDFAAAEAAYRAAIDLDPAYALAWLEYAMLLETLNRIGDMRALIEQAEGAGMTGPQIAFAEAWLLKRESRFAEALERADAAEGTVEPSRHAQLVGEICDRLGDPDRAFAAFAEMNRLTAIGPAADYARNQDFPGRIAAGTAALTPAVATAWPAVPPDGDRTAPIFVLGFPRSGTTLIDTWLMNLPELQIFEEAPMVERVEARLENPDRIAALTAAEADRLRAAYFDEAALVQPLDDRRIVDKFPLHMVRAPLIARLFPDAPFLFVERHPCDVVLSCFMARFQINRAMVHFQSIEGAARLYDLAMQAWTRAEALLPLRVHRIRYETMIADPAASLRPMLDTLGLPWRDAVLDNQSSAARRMHIATASYAQVTEPVYQRAAGRWRHYRRHLEPVLPVLAPWAERLGYEL